jgi:pimeloyl-ACP methyl ester carboxylesterase
MIERINIDKSECLVFFNPMSSDICFWKNSIPQELINNYEIIFIDYPGYNSPMDQLNSFDDLATYYHKLLLCKITKPIHLIGYSYGGLLIQHLLNNKYQHLKSVILIACSNKLAVRDKEIVSILKNVIVKDLYLFSRLLSLFSHKPKEINENPLIGLQKFSNLKITTKNYKPVLQQLNHVLQLKEIDIRKQSTKSLLIYGEEDRLIDITTLNRFQNLLNNIKIVKLNNESHIIEISKVFKHIIKFLKN